MYTHSRLRLWFYFSACLIAAFLAIATWLIWAAPRLLKIPDNFTYSADILSLDNFYDQDAKEFEGEQISKTTFKYIVTEQKPDYLVIKNIFDVSKMDATPIFSVNRLYYINPYNGQHVIIPEKKERVGYLFGPRYANTNGFYYWHINYDAPAPMKFINVEDIDGLTVYHYEANYTADQTLNLTYLPGVPTIRGIVTNIKLQLWIEPISGWLVKYQDNTLASYYNKKTGAIISPWNKFSNRYTQNSIRQQVMNATYWKWKILSYEFGVPILISLLTLLCMFIINIKINNPNIKLTQSIFNKIKSLNYTYIITLFIILFLLGSLDYIFLSQKHKSLFKIGISRWNDNPALLEAIKGFKDGLAENGFVEGKNIEFIIRNPNANIEKQINIIQSFLNENVDLIFTLTTPGTITAKGVAKTTPVVFTNVTYPVESNIISSSKTGKNNFVGSRNYIIPAEQFYDFDKLYPTTKNIGFIHHKGDSDSIILYQEYKKMLMIRGIKLTEIAAIDLNDLRNQLQQPRNYDAIFLACDTLIQGGGDKIVADFSRLNKIPSFSCAKESVLKGALVGYVADLYTIGKMAGQKAALILRGADIQWLQTSSPERGLLIINLQTAKLLGISIPTEMLKQADYVVDAQ